MQNYGCLSFASRFGQYDAFGNANYNELGSVDVENLSKQELKEYGLKAVKMFWENIPSEKRAVETPNFESFLRQVYHHPDHGDVTEEFIYDLGFILATYENSTLYKPAHLAIQYKVVIDKMPSGQIPQAHTLGNPIVRAAHSGGFITWLGIKKAMTESADEFKKPVMLGAGLVLGGFVGYKLIIALTALLGVWAVIRSGTK